MGLKKDRIQRRSKNWPFDDPRYQCRVREVTREVIREEGTKVIRTSTKATVPMGRIPDNALAFMNKSPFGGGLAVSMKHTNSPYSKGRRQKDGSVVYKWIRPKWKLLWTKTAVALIKDGHMKQLINPVSHRIMRGFLKVVPIFPPIPQVTKAA